MRREYAFYALALGIVLLFAIGTPAFAAKLADRVQNSSDIIKEIMSSPDKAIPEELLEKSKGIAIVPHVIKAGFVFGGNYGEGIVCARNPNGTWSPPAFVTLAGGSWGFQAGLEAIDVVLVIMTDRGMESILKNKVKLGAEAGVAAGPVGRAAQAATDVALKAEIYSYSRAKGLFAGLTLEGAVMWENDDADAAFYGKEVTSKEILWQFQGIALPAAAKTLDQTLDKWAS